MDAIRLDDYDYITKPFKVDDILVKVQRAVERHRLVTENAEYQGNLERVVQERTVALERRMGELTALNRMYRQYLEDDLSTDAKLASMSKSFFELAGQLQSLTEEKETEEKERRLSGEGPSSQLTRTTSETSNAYIWREPSWTESMLIDLPSGDQRGWRSHRMSPANLSAA